jgi:hypothetical protein
LFVAKLNTQKEFAVLKGLKQRLYGNLNKNRRYTPYFNQIQRLKSNENTLFMNCSDEFDFFHDSEELILTDFHVTLGVGSLDHVGNGVIIQVEETFADHGLKFSEIQVPSTVIIKMLEHFPDLFLNILRIKLELNQNHTICLDINSTNSLISITPEPSSSISSKIFLICSSVYS